MELAITGSEWKARALEVVATLRTLKPDQFYDGSRYHEVREELSLLIRSPEFTTEDSEEFSKFLKLHPGPKGWLPLEADLLRQMESSEIRFRIIRNIADERWVDGCLATPFSHGTLVGALERLIRDNESHTHSNE